jgi:hypothetical protein
MEKQHNSFKLLDELAYEEALDRDSSTEPRPVFGEPPERIYRELQGTFSSYRLLGQLVEVFLPRMVDTMICLTGGHPGEDAEEPPDAPPPPDPTPPTRPKGPLGDSGAPR